MSKQTFGNSSRKHRNVIFTYRFYRTFYKRKSGSRVEREDLKFMSPGGNKKFGDRGPGAAKKVFCVQAQHTQNFKR